MDTDEKPGCHCACDDCDRGHGRRSVPLGARQDQPEDLPAIIERDRQAACTNPTCHRVAADRRALLTYIGQLSQP